MRKVVLRRGSIAALLVSAGAVMLASRVNARPGNERIGVPRGHGPGPVSITTNGNKATITIGPISLSPAQHGTKPFDFEWPVSGWLNGYRVRLTNSRGDALPRSILHHLVVVNYGRRQLLYPIMERIIGASVDTDEIDLPGWIGVPLKKGERLGLYAAFQTATKLDSVFLHLTVESTTQRFPAQRAVLPVIVDVNFVAGETPGYDLPAGRSTRSFTFTTPITGRILGVGGHLHDHGTKLTLQDETGHSIATTPANVDKTGRLISVDRKIYYVPFTGPTLRPNVKYTLVAEYYNSTGHSIRHGAMGQMYLAFMPYDLSSWPALDTTDASYRKDLLSVRNGGGSNAVHSQH